MAKPGGKKRTAKAMRELIAAQEQSGKSIKSFCAENEIGVWVFTYWKKRLREMKDKSDSIAPFAEVKVSNDRLGKAESSVNLKVKVQQDFEVSIPSDFDAEHLKSVLQVLKTC